MNKPKLRLLLRHADGSVKLLDEYTEVGDFDEQYLFEFELGIVEIYDCNLGGEVELIEETAREYGLEYDFGRYIGWTVGDEMD